jgi:hypothetical protein
VRTDSITASSTGSAIPWTSCSGSRLVNVSSVSISETIFRCAS